MTKYREIIRLAQPELKLSQQKIAFSCGVSKKTVNKVLKAAREKNVSWPLPASYTDAFLEGLLFPEKREQDDACLFLRKCTVVPEERIPLFRSKYTVRPEQDTACIILASASLLA